MKPAEVAIVGVAESDIGRTPRYSALELMAQAARRAMADAGVVKGDIDGVIADCFEVPMPSVILSEYLQLRPRYTDTTSIGGSTFVTHLEHAAAAIGAGLCETVLIAYGSTQLSRTGGLATPVQPFPFEHPYGLVRPIAAYAMAAQRHMALYGTTSEQLAEIAVATRQWAALNPKAYRRDPITVEDVLNSEVICSPLHKLDCCLVTDGGGALVVTSAERARGLKKPVVRLIGSGTAHTHLHISQMPDLTRTA
ncbi:MAG: thiolase, partial [Clostridia bacterium]|nr:thiolase [Clostridia bacterium]